MKTRTKVFWFIGIAFVLFWPVLIGLGAIMPTPGWKNYDIGTVGLGVGLSSVVTIALMNSVVWPPFAFFVKKYEEKNYMFSFSVYVKAFLTDTVVAKMFCEEFANALAEKGNGWRTEINVEGRRAFDPKNKFIEYFFLIASDDNKLLAAIPLTDLGRLIVYEDRILPTIQTVLSNRKFINAVNKRLGHHGFHLLVDVVD